MHISYGDSEQVLFFLFHSKFSYRCCADYVSQIATCNKAGTSLTTDTAAVRWNFCGRECTPAFPEWCKKKEEGKGKLN